MFHVLQIETSSWCNRACVTCLRQTYPDRDRIKPWFSQNYLPTETVVGLLEAGRKRGNVRRVAFNLYNEPTLDPRLPVFVRMAKELGYPHVLFCTNGDMLTKRLAADLDGWVDSIRVALYPSREMEGRKGTIRSLFYRTAIRFTGGKHRSTHFLGSRGGSGHDEALEFHCRHAAGNLIVNHQGDVCLCCDEITPDVYLGNAILDPIPSLWEHEGHVRVVMGLRHPGGRKRVPYCRTCPKTARERRTITVEAA